MEKPAVCKPVNHWIYYSTKDTPDYGALHWGWTHRKLSTSTEVTQEAAVMSTKHNCHQRRGTGLTCIRNRRETHGKKEGCSLFSAFNQQLFCDKDSILSVYFVSHITNQMPFSNKRVCRKKSCKNQCPTSCLHVSISLFRNYFFHQGRQADTAHCPAA